jgi:hypothetical protein
MKKSLLLICFALLSALQIQAQCIPLTSNMTPGLTPDSATGLSAATVGVAYSQVLQIYVPATTPVEVLPGVVINVPVISVELNSLTGLPPGLTYACNPTACLFPGNSHGCAEISGTPTVAGNFTLTAITTSIGTVFGVPTTQVDTLDYYMIDVTGSSVGIYESTGLGFYMNQNSPNPCSEYTNIRYVVPGSGEVDFRLFNLIGKEVYRSILTPDQGENELRFDTRDLAPGVYMYSMTFNGETLTKRLVISRK